jgi:hypothetical protein
MLQNFIWLRGNILLAFGRLVDYKLGKNTGQGILPYHRASYQKLLHFALITFCNKDSSGSTTPPVQLL